MATVIEQSGRVLSTNEHERRFAITGAASDVAARSAVLAATSSAYDGKTRVDDEIQVEDFGDIPDVYLATVPYRRGGGARPETGYSEFSFSTQGGTARVTQSRHTVNTYGSRDAPNFRGAINVQDNQVQGVDVVAATYAFDQTEHIAAASVTNEYKAKLFRLTGRMNDAPFKELDTYECLFIGAAGNYRRPEDDYRIKFAFLASENLTGLTVGGITGIVKAGWDYLWTLYEADVDDGANFIVRKPIAAYVERVYKTGSFADLGIGT